MSGCMLTFGPLFRGKKGLGSFLSAIRSRFSSRGTAHSASRTAEQTDFGGSAGRHSWKVLSGPHERSESSDAIKYRVDWELVNVESSDEMQRSRSIEV